MADSESDEDLKRAIELSLQEDRPPSTSRKAPIIDLTSSDDEDDDLDAPVSTKSKPGPKEQSPGGNSPTKQVKASLDKPPSTSLSIISQPSSATHPMPNPILDTSGFMSLNRKQMEEDRLARVNKRKREEDSSTTSIEIPKKTKIHSPSFRDYQTPQHLSITQPMSNRIASNVLSYQEQQLIFGPNGVQFPDGIVKKTWAHGYPRQDDIKIEEVLQKNDLELAVLSAYQVDADWVTSKLLETTKWGESGGIMENIVFLIDLPRLPGGQLTSPDQLTKFGKDLIYFVKAMGLEEAAINSIYKFDFSRTSHLAFVHSIGGSHSGSSWQRTGYCGLGTSVRELSLHNEEPFMGNIDIVAASIGNLNDGFLRSMYLACQGDNGIKEYTWRTKRNKPGTESQLEKQLSDDLKSQIQIYFPTKDTVAASKGGIAAGGTICLQSKWFDANTFPRHLMRDCKSLRDGMLMHCKMILVRPDRGTSWAYLGSSNFSESACRHGRKVDLADKVHALKMMCISLWGRTGQINEEAKISCTTSALADESDSVDLLMILDHVIDATHKRQQHSSPLLSSPLLSSPLLSSFEPDPRTVPSWHDHQRGEKEKSSLFGTL
ncbi:hypothetical protein B7494_g6030 [Chlorociboria aeruginascens]|nr:hypothetical protein B7494_g6030 [Chlorociboria aeruginascens]